MPDEEGLSADCSEVDAVGGVEVGVGVVVEVDTPGRAAWPDVVVIELVVVGSCSDAILSAAELHASDSP